MYLPESVRVSLWGKLFSRGTRREYARPGAAAGSGRDLPAVLGVVAGRGIYPLELCRAARRAGVPRLAVVALRDEAAADIEALADHVDWVHVGQLRRTMRCLRDQGASDVMFVGQVRPGRLFGEVRPDFLALRLLWSLKERNAHTLFGAVADAFEKNGFHVLPAYTFLEESLAQAGVLGRVQPTRAQWRDIRFGAGIARAVSQLDIGQTVIVRNGTVLAVEGFEGTDQAIRRGGELGKGRATVVKVAKPGHDLRFDVPCIGVTTVDALAAAGVKALAVQAGKTLFLERDKVLAALNAAGIAAVGIDLDAFVSGRTDSLTVLAAAADIGEQSNRTVPVAQRSRDAVGTACALGRAKEEREA